MYRERADFCEHQHETTEMRIQRSPSFENTMRCLCLWLHMTLFMPESTLFLAATNGRPLSKTKSGLWSRSRRKRRTIRKRRRSFSKPRAGVFILHPLSTTMTRCYVCVYINMYMNMCVIQQEAEAFFKTKGGRTYFAPLSINEKMCLFTHVYMRMYDSPEKSARYFVFVVRAGVLIRTLYLQQ